jgi:hypothetical protein
MLGCEFEYGVCRPLFGVGSSLCDAVKGLEAMEMELMLALE